MSSTWAHENEFLDYTKVVMEERAWAGLQSKTLKVDDLVWSYSEGGSVQAPTLLLLHGLGTNRDQWNKVARQLVPYYHVILVDLPGSGQTKTPSYFNYSIENMADQLRRFAEVARIQNELNIVGHSMGGNIALLYASKYNFDTKSLFVLSTGGHFQNKNTSYLQNPAYLKQLIVTQPGDLTYVNQKTMVNPPFVPSIFKKYDEQMLIQHAEENRKIVNQLISTSQNFTAEQFTQMLKNIQAPTLILWGKQDRIVNVEVAQELKARIKNSGNPILLDRVGHIPALEAPDLVVSRYLDFLKSVHSPSNNTTLQ